MSNKNYNPGKLWPIIQVTTSLIRQNPDLLKEENRELLKATIQHNIPELTKPEECANCGASMIEYIFEFDALDAIMLLIMGKEVRQRMDVQSMSFTDANKLKVQALDEATYAMKSRTTQMAKLGLIAKVMVDDRHVPGTWLITRRGFDALEGKPVPRRVTVWRNKIQARTDELITLREAFQRYQDKVEATLRRNKEPRSDYRDRFVGYQPAEWYGMGHVVEGKLI